MEILDQYQMGSGQLVNMSKSAIFFSNNCTEIDKEAVSQSTTIQKEALSEKYLGLPTAVVEVPRQHLKLFREITWFDGRLGRETTQL